MLICSRNPRAEYLQAVLEALRAQTLPVEHWELILVDNGSSPGIAVDLSWHPRGRIVVEPETGILPARLTAIREAAGELLCFFDDDTPPCANYLQAGLELGAAHPWLGAWGAASIVGKFEAPVPAWAKPFLNMLALRSEKGNYWSNMEDWRTIPYSGGMVFRRALGAEFLQWIDDHREARLLGRKADALLAHEDIALARMAFRLNLGTGIFEQLRLDHFIPARRLERDYLTRLAEGFGYSGVLSKWINGEPFRPVNKGFVNRLLDLLQLARKPAAARACTLAGRRGARAAVKFIDEQHAAQNRAETALAESFKLNPLDWLRRKRLG